MKIETYEQAEEALKAIADFCAENDGCNFFASLGDGFEQSSTSCVGRYSEIVPSLTMAFISDSSLKDMFMDALDASTDPEIVKAYWQANPQNIQN